MRKFFVMAVALSSILVGCSNPTSTEIASSLNGAWKLNSEVPGGFFGFSLTATGTDVSGDGTFLVEAGPGGHSTVTGTVTGNEVVLDFVVITELTEGDRTSTAHFIGNLELGWLRGKWQFGAASPDNPPQPVQFIRNNGIFSGQ